MKNDDEEKNCISFSDVNSKLKIEQVTLTEPFSADYSCDGLLGVYTLSKGRECDFI